MDLSPWRKESGEKLSLDGVSWLDMMQPEMIKQGSPDGFKVSDQGHREISFNSLELLLLNMSGIESTNC